MAVLPILEIPHPVLRKRAKKVRSITNRELKLASDMVDTMRENGGVGLAANQVGELRRVIVLQMPDEQDARIYFNPEIMRRSGLREVEEGCLSLPGFRGIVNRSVWIKFQGVDHTDQFVKFKDENLETKHNKAGLLSMANSGPNTNGSQFFITTVETPHLDGKHVVFGEVVKGFEYIKTLENVRTDSNDKPYQDIKIVDIREI